MDLPKNLRGKLENLTFFLRNKKVIVAFSGGVDNLKTQLLKAFIYSFFLIQI